MLEETAGDLAIAVAICSRHVFSYYQPFVAFLTGIIFLFIPCPFILMVKSETREVSSEALNHQTPL